MSDSYNYFIKGQSSILDFSVDWTQWLDDDTLSSVVWTVPSGITKHDENNSSYIATIWLSGGTLGQSYDIVCSITTIAGRVDSRTITVIIRDR